MTESQSQSISREEFARAFQRFLDWVPTAVGEEGGFPARLKEHFGVAPTTFPVTTFEVAVMERRPRPRRRLSRPCPTRLM